MRKERSSQTLRSCCQSLDATPPRCFFDKGIESMQGITPRPFSLELSRHAHRAVTGGARIDMTRRIVLLFCMFARILCLRLSMAR